MYPASVKAVFEPGTTQKADGLTKILTGASLKNCPGQCSCRSVPLQPPTLVIVCRRDASASRLHSIMGGSTSQPEQSAVASSPASNEADLTYLYVRREASHHFSCCASKGSIQQLSNCVCFSDFASGHFDLPPCVTLPGGHGPGAPKPAPNNT